MNTQYDEKGKLFTPVVSKHPVPVIIQTNIHQIRGTMHIHLNSRIKDELNGQERFIAVTDAVVYNSLNEENYRSKFLLVNSDHILWLIPEEEAGQ